MGTSHLLAPLPPLSRPEAALRRIVADLRLLGRQFALVGGFAVSARTEPRLTRDADFAVRVDDDPDAESLVRDLQARGWRVVGAVEQEAAGRLATVRLAIAGEDGFSVPVATLGHLIALKVLARDDRPRPHDRVDLGAVLGRADVKALEEGRRALRLVAERGFHRGLDLLTALEAARKEFRGRQPPARRGPDGGPATVDATA